MSDLPQPFDAFPFDESSLPIEVQLGKPQAKMGMAVTPMMFIHFYRHLVSDGERLNDTEAMTLLQVMALREMRDYELRVDNLFLACSTATIEKRYKAKFRRMGLVFTERLYYPVKAGKTPVMRSQRWDFRSLFHNLELVFQVWLDGQKRLVAGWKSSGQAGRKPVYTLPREYTHEIVLPLVVIQEIIADRYYPVPEKWVQHAQEKGPTDTNRSGTVAELPTVTNRSGTQAPTDTNRSGREGISSPNRPPTATNRSGTQAPTDTNRSGNLFKEDEEEEGGRIGQTAPGDPAQQVFAYFARCKGISDYQPSRKDQSALKAMLTDGYSLQEILDWIDLAFAQPKKPQHFTFVHILARQSRLAMDNRPPQCSDLPDAGRSDPHPNQPDSGGQTILEGDIQAALDIYQSTGREVNSDVLARLRLLAGRCDAAAREQGSTGGAWLADALEAALGIADPNRVLNYAATALSDWTVNGKPGGATKAARDAAPEDLAPELVIFQEATGGRLPLPDQRQIVIDAIRQCGFTAEYLRPFWDAWVAQDRKRSSLDWLLDWADKGAIPQPYYGKTQTSDKPEFKSLSTIQSLMKKYGGTNP